MTLVERLRAENPGTRYEMCKLQVEAADEIERLQRELGREAVVEEGETPIVDAAIRRIWCAGTLNQGDYEIEVVSPDVARQLELRLRASEAALEQAELELAATQDTAQMLNHVAMENKREAETAEQSLQEERAIVDRVWKSLGITTYDQAKPYAIDEHVAQLRQSLQEVRRDAERKVALRCHPKER